PPKDRKQHGRDDSDNCNHDKKLDERKPATPVAVHGLPPLPVPTVAPVSLDCTRSPAAPSRIFRWRLCDCGRYRSPVLRGGKPWQSPNTDGSPPSCSPTSSAGALSPSGMRRTRWSCWKSTIASCARSSLGTV